jgi:hypothetical protein
VSVLTGVDVKMATSIQKVAFSKAPGNIDIQRHTMVSGKCSKVRSKVQ